jgi:hypothetical protein
MAERSNRLSPSGARLVFGLLALLFVAVGVVAASMSWHAAAEADAMRSWVEVPATISRAELETSIRHDRGYHGRDLPRTRARTTYLLTAQYEYKFDGQRFTGDRVSVHGNRHSNGPGITFLVNSHRELKRHLDLRQPFRCFVNPQKPSESVLYRDIRWKMAAGYTLFATLFGSIGFGILTSVLASTWKWLRRGAANVHVDVSSSGVATLVLAVLVIWWAIALYPLVARLPELLASGGLFAWTTLVFPLVGIALLLAFAYQVIRRLTHRSHSA